MVLNQEEIVKLFRTAIRSCFWTRCLNVKWQTHQSGVAHPGRPVLLQGHFPATRSFQACSSRKRSHRQARWRFAG